MNFENMKRWQLVNVTLILTKTVKILRERRIKNVRFWQVVNWRQEALNRLAELEGK